MRIDGRLLKTPFPYESLAELNSIEKINSHLQLRAKFLITEETYQDLTHGKYDKGALEFSDEKTQENVLFGYFSKVAPKKENDLCYVTIESKGYSSLLEFGEYSCSFQNIHNTTYSEMLNTVAGRKNDTQIFVSTEVNCNIATGVNTNDYRLNKPVIMYKETVWDFVLRMAGRAGSFITPNNQSEKPELFMGIPKRETIVLSSKEIINAEEKVLEFNKANETNASKKPAMRTAVYRLRSNHNLSDSLNHKGIEYIVSEKHIVFASGQFSFYYTLVRRQDIDSLFVQPFSNKRLGGVSLKGTVVKRNPNAVKVHLDIDESKSTASYWFNHDTTAMSGFQSIPELDTEVWLYVNGEDVPYVEHSIHHPLSRHEDYNERSFENQFKKSMYLLQDQISFVTEGDNVRLSDHRGIIVNTNKKLTLTAKKDIKIKTYNKLRITTPEYFKANKRGRFSGLEVYSGQLHTSSARIVMSANKSKKEKPPAPVQVSEPKKVGLNLAQTVLAGVAISQKTHKKREMKRC